MTEQYYDAFDEAEERYLTERRLAERWDLSRRTLQRWRAERYGPVWLQLGGSVRYPVEEVLAFETAARSGGE